MDKYVDIELVRETLVGTEERIADEIERVLDPLEVELDREEGWAKKKSSETAKNIIIDILLWDFPYSGSTPDKMGFLPNSIEEIENIIRNGPLGSGENYDKILEAMVERLLIIAERDNISPEEEGLLRAAKEASRLRIRKEVLESI